MKQLFYLLFILPLCVFSQEKITGNITEDIDGKEVPLSGANVYWLNTQVGTVTDFDGNFELGYKPEYKKMVISFVGYKTDTISVNAPKHIMHSLKSTANLDEITVTARQRRVRVLFFSRKM